MEQIRTTDSVATAGRLCREAAGLPQNKAAMAAMMADAFINGMNMQARIYTTDAAHRPESRT